MRKQLRERDLFFSSLREFRPELPYSSFDVDLVFLQKMQETRTAESFSRRPDQNEGVVLPRLLATAVAKSAVKLEQLLSVLPNRNGCAKLAELIEVLVKERFNPRTQRVYLQSHRQML